jgi:hypothetical protein
MTKSRKGKRARNKRRNAHTNQHAIQTRQTYKLKEQTKRLARILGIPYGRRSDNEHDRKGNT